MSASTTAISGRPGEPAALMRAGFEAACLCLQLGLLARADRHTDDALALQHYRSRCTCSHSYHFAGSTQPAAPSLAHPCPSAHTR